MAIFSRKLSDNDPTVAALKRLIMVQVGGSGNMKLQEDIALLNKIIKLQQLHESLMKHKKLTGQDCVRCTNRTMNRPPNFHNEDMTFIINDDDTITAVNNS